MASSTAASPPPLGHREKRFWPADPAAYGRKRERRGGSYEVFIPEPIEHRRFDLGEDAVAAIAEATKALQALDGRPPELGSLEAVARNLLRSESSASSRIEGLQLSHRRLARAAYAEEHGRDSDPKAAEVLGNVRAMERALELGSRAGSFTQADILDIHRLLLRFTADREIAGVIREKQNWIGGNDYNPIGAAFVPPPPEAVDDLLDDLCRFIERTDIAPMAQAAITHAQFENIHPFVDGNGRVGRALIYTVLRRRGDTARYIPPISLVLGAEPKNYIRGLGAFSGGNVSAWSELLAQATTRAAGEAHRLADAIQAKQTAWLERLGNPRRDSAVRELVSRLPEQPVMDVGTGQQLTGKSHVAVGAALRQLERAGILEPFSERKWGRVWECRELLDLVSEFERAVSTP